MWINKLTKLILLPVFFCIALNSCSGGGGSSPKHDDKFTITWKNYDGTTLETDEVLYNTLPEYKAATPTKPDDTQHSYTFDLWTPKVVVATSNATYTATYKSTLTKALISFNLNGGYSEHSTDSKYVTSIKKEDFFFNVTKSGVNFRGWTYNGTKVFDEKGNQLITPTLEERMTFVATYAENASMTIKKTVSKGGQVSSSDAVGNVTGEGYYHYNTEVDVSANANAGYEFLGWYYQNNLLSNNPKYKYKMWSSDVELEARFNLLSFKLKVKAAQTDYGKVKINIDGHSTYKDEDEATIYYTDQVEIAAYTSIEEKRFLGWYNSDFSFVESNAVYSFVMPHNEYTLSAVWGSTDVYNVSISSSDSSLASVSGGGKCFYHAPTEVTTTPKVSEDAATFFGWYENDQLVSTNLTYKIDYVEKNYNLVAKWKEGKYYKVTWTNYDDKVLATDLFKSGETPTYSGSTPQKPSTTEHDYTFTDWSPTPAPISSSQTYKAQFSESTRKYTVTVTSEDSSRGTVSGGGLHAYNSSVTIEATPNTGYSFEGWYKNGVKVPSASASYTFTMPANDVSYEARFISSGNMWYLKSDWWNYCSNGITGEQATKEDIGREVKLTVNNQVHKVRLIGIGHDELYSGSGKAHCTFEFSNLFSDSNGYSLATLWNTDKGISSTNYDYLNSDIRKALDGKGSGTLRWYQKGSSTRSSYPYNTSVYNMLPSGLQSKIRTVKKEVATTSSYNVTNYDAKVFALTHNEMTANGSSYAKEEGTTYQYYIDHKDVSSRIKHQIKWHEGAVTVSTSITDLDWNPHNYAGYNYSTENYGGDYWLSSPNTNYSGYAWDVGDDGNLNNYNVYNYAFAVAPAFCI